MVKTGVRVQFRGGVGWDVSFWWAADTAGAAGAPWFGFDRLAEAVGPESVLLQVPANGFGFIRGDGQNHQGAPGSGQAKMSLTPFADSFDKSPAIGLASAGFLPITQRVQ